MKGMIIPSGKTPGCKDGGVRNRVFMTSERLNMAELATIAYLVKSKHKECSGVCKLKTHV